MEGNAILVVFGDFKTQLAVDRQRFSLVSLFRLIETTQNRMEPWVNQQLGFEAIPKLVGL